MLLNNVAEAIFKEHVRAGAATGSWADVDGHARELFTAYARAAVRAMSHPTRHMLAEGNRALQTWEHSEHYRSPVDGIWHAMITAEVPAEQPVRRESFDEV
jgi:hypothetical protein